MKGLVDLLTQVTDLRTHGIMSIYALQFKLRYKLLCSKVQVVDTIGYVVDATDKRNEKTVAIEAENKLIHYVRVQGFYN